MDSDALKAAIRAGRLRAVVLDVWENEPNIDTGLLKMVDIGTPHIAGYSLDGKIAGMIMIYKSVCEHFSIEPKFEAADFLPEPAVPELKVSPDIDNVQEVLSGAVQKVYRIDRDDARLRRILDKPAEKRGEFFDGLRKNYQVRREFRNTKVVVEERNSILAGKLAGIGFKVESEK